MQKPFNLSPLISSQIKSIIKRSSKTSNHQVQQKQKKNELKNTFDWQPLDKMSVCSTMYSVNYRIGKYLPESQSDALSNIQHLDNLVCNTQLAVFSLKLYFGHNRFPARPERHKMEATTSLTQVRKKGVSLYFWHLPHLQGAGQWRGTRDTPQSSSEVSWLKEGQLTVPQNTKTAVLLKEAWDCSKVLRRPLPSVTVISHVMHRLLPDTHDTNPI